MKINTLYNTINFPKVLNFWKVTLLFALFSLQTAVFGQRVDTNPKAYATLDTNAMLIGDKGKMRLSVELESGEKLIAAQPDLPIDTAHFELQNVGKWNIESRAPKLEREITYIAWDSGLYRIEPILFTIQDANGNIRNVQTQPLLLTVNNPQGTEGMLAPIGIKDIVKEELAWEDVMPYIIGVILIAALSFLAFVAYKKWQNRNIAPVIQKIVQPPHVIAERLLQELNAKQLWQNGKIKEFYSELSHILRGYLEDQFTMPALESTTDELIATLQKRQFEDIVVDKTQSLLQTADLVKFAKVEPPMNVHDGFWRDAVEVVELTKPKPILENAENQEINAVKKVQSP